VPKDVSCTIHLSYNDVRYSHLTRIDFKKAMQCRGGNDSRKKIIESAFKPGCHTPVKNLRFYAQTACFHLDQITAINLVISLLDVQVATLHALKDEGIGHTIDINLT